MIDITRFLNGDIILINDKSTWQQNLINIIEKNKSIIRKFNYMETYNYNLHEAAKNCIPVKFENLNRPNKYYDEFTYLKECVKYELKKLTIIGYHATRLTKEEINKIKKDGLVTSSKENCYKRAENLLLNGYISKDECDYIKSQCILNNPLEINRLGQIWFLTGNCDISTKNFGLNNLYQDYGGETIRNGIENTQLLKKLNQLSFPCSVISYIKLNTIPLGQMDNLAEKLLLNYTKKNIKKISCEIYSESESIPVIDIIFVNEHTKLKFTK